MLCGYNEQYETLLLNIYEPVLVSALGCVLVGVSANSLEITPDIHSGLYHHFAKKEQTEIEQMLGRALSKLAETLSFSDGLHAYVKQSLPLLAATIESAIKWT